MSHKSNFYATHTCLLVQRIHMATKRCSKAWETHALVFSDSLQPPSHCITLLTIKNPWQTYSNQGDANFQLMDDSNCLKLYDDKMSALPW